jgi:hypothetical protein
MALTPESEVRVDNTDRENKARKALKRASDPACTPTRHTKLASSKDPTVLLALVSNPSVSEELLIAVASKRNQRVEILTACASNPAAGTECLRVVAVQLERSLQRGGWEDLQHVAALLLALVNNEAATTELLEFAATFTTAAKAVQYLMPDARNELRLALALNVNSPPEVVLELSTIFDFLMSWVRSRMETEKDFELLRACVVNPMLPTERLVELSGHSEPLVREMVAEHMVTLLAS